MRTILLGLLCATALSACEMNYRGSSGSGGGQGGSGGSAGGGSGSGGGSASSGGGSAGGGSAGGGAGDCNTINATGPWTVYPDPYLDGGANPAAGVSGGVKSCTMGAGTRVILAVSGLTASRAYGAHVHVAACDAGQGGAHYRNDAAAGATPQNEIWLDFTSSATGDGANDVTATWAVRAGQAKSVIIHSRTTDDAGTAGPKLSCVDVPF